MEDNLLYHNINNTPFKIKFTNNLNEALTDESFAFRNMNIFIYECHESCLTCNNYLYYSCLSCPPNASTPSAYQCKCNLGYYLHNHQCFTACPSDYKKIESTRVC